MKIVVDISEDDLYAMKYLKVKGWANKHELQILNGTPLAEIFDEIKTEIDEQVLENLSDGGDDWFTAEKINDCLEIINKYKTK